MLAALGDLVDDVVVRIDGTVNEATDTVARIERRRGGSAANVAVAAAAAGAAARFIGRVGDDALGEMLIGELGRAGVDVSAVSRRGRTGTIVVIVDRTGERSMLSDRAAAVELANPDPAWLDGVQTLHLPLYSLDGGPIASTSRTLVEWAHQRDVVVSVDVSSVDLIRRLGIERVYGMLGELRPAVIFANHDEAESLGIDGAVAGAVTVVKHGAHPVEVHHGAERSEFRVPEIAGVVDTTGAGDAFAAGFLVAGLADLDDLERACAAGCESARALIVGR